MLICHTLHGKRQVTFTAQSDGELNCCSVICETCLLYLEAKHRLQNLVHTQKIKKWSWQSMDNFCVKQTSGTAKQVKKLDKKALKTW